MARARVTADTPIFVPGRGQVDLAVWRLQEAVSKYDERLVLGRNEDNGQWCVFVRMPRGGDWPELYPVLGITDPPHSVEQLPGPLELCNRIHNADTRRTGDRILHEVINSRDVILAPLREAAAQAEQHAAEVVEFTKRQLGETRHARVSMNGRALRRHST